MNQDNCEVLLLPVQDNQESESLFKVPQDICEGLLAVPQDCGGLAHEDCESLFVSCEECDSILALIEENTEPVSRKRLKQNY